MRESALRLGPHSLTILVVDDCPDALDLIEIELAEKAIRVVRAADGAEAWLAFQDEAPDLIVTDVRMPDVDGFDLLRKVREVSDVPLILLTAHAEVSAAVAAMRAGADDYLRYPDDLESLAPRIQTLAARKGWAKGDAAERHLVGTSRAVEALRKRVRQLAGLRAPLLFRGEAGSGRGLAARVLHELSGASGPLRVVEASDASVPRGEGVALLRDFDQFPTEAQRAWTTEHHRIRAGSSSLSRLLVTTCSFPNTEAPPIPTPLWKDLSNFVIEVPALRERIDDLEPLAEGIAQRAARQLGCEPVRFAADAIETLASYRWPGNVADLHRVLEKSVAYSAGGFLGSSAIQESLRLVIAQKNEGLSKRRAARQGAERSQLVELLSQCGGNVAEMARRMDLTRGAVAYRLKKHGLAS